MISRGKRGGRDARVEGTAVPSGSRCTLWFTGLESSVRSMKFCWGVDMTGLRRSRPSPGNLKGSGGKNNELKEADALGLELWLEVCG